MHSAPAGVSPQAPIRIRRSRQKVVGTVVDFEQARAAQTSQRQFAKQRGVPRTTLQAWLARKEKLDSSAQVVAFFESPDGLAFLHRLVLADHLVFGQMGACGSRLMCEFLDQAQLGPLVAHSVGSQHKVARAIEEQILVYAAQQRAKLGAKMKPKQISVCEDETFHPAVCLVALEPVSNFLLVERYAEKRDAATWTQALEQGLAGLAVQVVQVTRDEAAGLLRHARTELQVNHSPEVFHSQYDVSRGTAGALEGQLTQGKGAYDTASEALQRVLADQQQVQQEHKGPGRPVDFARRITDAEQTLTQAQANLGRAQANRETMKQLVRSVGTSYHPLDLVTGVAQSEAEVHTALEHIFRKIRTLAGAAGLAEAAFKRIGKAHRVVVAMVVTIGFFHRTVQQRVAAAALSEPLTPLVLKVLVPGLYLLAAAGKLPTAAERNSLRQLAQALLGTLKASAAWQALSATVQQDLRHLALDCAQLFQRSSSCVEGRNGYLALRHHQLRRLSDAKLAVLTALHNYVCKRQDETTAAERFFGAKPDDLLDTLCDRVALLARPRAGRAVPAASPHPESHTQAA